MRLCVERLALVKNKVEHALLDKEICSKKYNIIIKMLEKMVAHEIADKIKVVDQGKTSIGDIYRIQREDSVITFLFYDDKTDMEKEEK